jgi:hypothetical protein
MDINDLTGTYRRHIGSIDPANPAVAYMNDEERISLKQIDKDKYEGYFDFPELPQRAYPNWPYDAKYEVQVFRSDAKGKQYPTISILMYGRSSDEVNEYDCVSVFSGYIREDNAEGLPYIIYGIAYDQNGDLINWTFRPI